MELYRQTEPDRIYKWKDVTFYLRPHATSGDRHSLTMLGDLDNGKASIPRSIFYRRAIELFVTRWEGVTAEGKAVPFSMLNLDSLPTIMEEGDLLCELGSFIYNHCVHTLDENKKKA